MEDSLKSVNLFNGGVADKQAGKYSGGMKRRLSVAISLIGDPKVCHCLSQNYFSARNLGICCILSMPLLIQILGNFAGCLYG